MTGQVRVTVRVARFGGPLELALVIASSLVDLSVMMSGSGERVLPKTGLHILNISSGVDHHVRRWRARPDERKLLHNYGAGDDEQCHRDAGR
jgi:hypothetical protein